MHQRNYYQTTTHQRSAMSIYNKFNHSVTRRPWSKHFPRPSSYSLPSSFGEFTSRFWRKLIHFRPNYAEIVLSALLVILLWYPNLIIVCSVLIVALLLIVVVISVVFTVAALAVLIQVWSNWLVFVLIGVGIVVLHAAFRELDEDLFYEAEEEEEAAEDDGGLASEVGSNDDASSTTDSQY